MESLLDAFIKNVGSPTGLIFFMMVVIGFESIWLLKVVLACNKMAKEKDETISELQTQVTELNKDYSDSSRDTADALTRLLDKLNK